MLHKASLNPKIRQRIYFIIFFAITVLVSLLISFVLWRSYQAATREAETTTRDYASLIAQRFELVLERSESILESQATEIPLQVMQKSAIAANRSVISQQLANHTVAFPDLTNTAIIDANGDLLYSSNLAVKPFNIADRAYFQHLKNDPSSKIVFSEAILARSTGRWSLVMARAIRDNAGQFIGVTTVLLDLNNEENQLKSLMIDSSSVAGIRRRDTTNLLLRIPFVESEVNAPLPKNNPIRSFIESDKAAKTLIYQSAIDNTERLVSLKRLNNYPYHIFVGVTKSNYLAAWYKQMYWMLGIEALFLGLLGKIMLQLFRAESRAMYANERLTLATRAGGVGIWDYDISKNTLEWDDQMFSLYGTKRDQFKGAYEAWIAGLHPEDKADADEISQQVLNGQKDYDTEFRVVWPDGTVRHIRALAIVERDKTGRALHMLGTNWDITDLKNAETLLQKAKSSAESLAQSKSEFLANMSHEIRTPMNAIIGLSQLALNQDMSTQVRDYLTKINTSSESLLGILNDILDFSKINADKLNIENKPFKINDLAESLHAMFSARATEKNLNFSLQVASEIPKVLVGDALRIQQILSNLIGNALKFTHKGRVAVAVKLVRLENSLAQICFSVSDTGIGLSEADQSKLFQPFSQADSSITRRFGGTGLGLSISQGLLKLMGGTFTLESEAGNGTTFSFELTLGVSATQLRENTERRITEKHARSLTTELQAQGSQLTGKRILIAEDNLINQIVVKEFLKLSGINFDIANNGIEALALLQSHRYDAILMDVHMPQMGGVEATHKIREQPQHKDLPIIALTAGVTEEEREKCQQSGMNDFVTKPINPTQLIHVLCQWINLAETPTEVAKISTDAAPVLPSLSGFDLAILRNMLGDDEALIRQLLITFREDIARNLTEITSQIHENNLLNAANIAHSIKGSAGNLGANTLYQAASNLETELRQNQLDPAALEAFKRLLSETQQTLNTLN